MLSSEDEAITDEVLIKYVLAANYGSARAALAPGLYDDLLINLRDGPNLTMIAQARLLAVVDGYNRTPPAIVRLLKLVEALDPRIPPLIARLSAAGPLPAAHNPFNDVLLFGRLPFLERRPTRTALIALLNAQPVYPFVIVNGLGKLGKSYTTQLIRHALIVQASLSQCVIDAPRGQLASIGPEQVARELVISMGGRRDDEPPTQTDTDQWCKELAIWVIETGLKGNLTWWVVLDGFNGPGLRADTKTFIVKLALAFANGLATRQFRLILLDFDPTALPVAQRVKADTPGPISKASVQSFVAAVFAGAPQIDPQQVFAVVTDGLPDPIDDLPELGQRLCDAIDAAEIGA